MQNPDHILTKIAALAALDLNADADTTTQLAHDVGVIMNYVEQLKQIDTQGVSPLLHPLDLHQRLRIDDVSEESCLEQLAELAPLFDKDLYLVPKTLHTDD